MAGTTQLYSIRPGRFSDIWAVTRLYSSGFGKDMDYIFPMRHKHPKDFLRYMDRFFIDRYWQPQWRLTALVDPTGRLVGYTWWSQPMSQVSFAKRWLSPFTWLGYLVRKYIAACNYFFPVRSMGIPPEGPFAAVFAVIGPKFLTTPRRKNAWYLSTLVVDHADRGQGLGLRLLKHGLQLVDEAGSAAWLISVAGLEKFYGLHGFVEVTRANILNWSEWDGGAVMVRE